MTVVKVYEGEIEPINIEIGISQRLPILPILFFFFVANLLNATNNEALQTSSFTFINDTHILTYGNSIERNCKIFKRIHKEYKEWSRMHRAKFALKKYELIHFAKRLRNFNMQTIIRIGKIEKVTTDHIRILRMQINSKLKWKLYIIKIKKKFAMQSLAISCILTLI